MPNFEEVGELEQQVEVTLLARWQSCQTRLLLRSAFSQVTTLYKWRTV